MTSDIVGAVLTARSRDVLNIDFCSDVSKASNSDTAWARRISGFRLPDSRITSAIATIASAKEDGGKIKSSHRL